MVSVHNYNSILYENLDRLVEGGSLTNKKIVLFGLNSSSYATKDYLEKKGLKIYAYIDNNAKKLLDIEEFIDDTLRHHLSSKDYDEADRKFVRAYKPESLLEPFDDNAVILIASKYYPSMLLQLEKMGYKENAHVFKTVDFYGLDEILKRETDIVGKRELTTEEIRAKQLELVAYIVDVCEKNELNYYMTGGTLLGAVRHKGYIPWDDDIDLTIPMPDYRKMIDIMIAEDKYEVYTMYNNPESCNAFYMRLIDRDTIRKSWGFPYLTTSGVDIDIFPLIGMPDNANERQAFFDRLRRLVSRYYLISVETEKITDEILDKKKRIRDEVLEMIEKYNFYESEYGGYILSKYWERDIMPTSVYDGKIEMPFEDTTLIAPTGYKEYLERIFGDFMKLPPEKEQYVTHNYKIYER